MPRLVIVQPSSLSSRTYIFIYNSYSYIYTRNPRRKKGIYILPVTEAHAKTPSRRERSGVFGKEGPVISVIKGLGGVRDSQLLAIVLAESVIFRTQDLVKVSSLVDEDSVKTGKSAKSFKGVGQGMTQLAPEFIINRPEGRAKIHGTVLGWEDVGVGGGVGAPAIVCPLTKSRFKKLDTPEKIRPQYQKRKKVDGPRMCR